MTYKTGSIGEFMQWTKSVISTPDAAGAPKRWFDSDGTASKVLGTTTSPEASGIKNFKYELLHHTQR